MFYILNEPYRLRGWSKLPYALYDVRNKHTVFFDKEGFSLLSHCDGLHCFDEQTMSEETRSKLDKLLQDKIIREATFGELLRPEQEYHLYPCRYKREVHWSITGRCNLKCRHCFMSAPGGKHGHPTREQLMDLIAQFDECGISQVGITGGEPLIRDDLLDIIRELTRREIGINCIFTNGWLLDEAFLDALEEIGIKPPFQLSFDGVGQHDFLRGIEGCEARTIAALQLLQRRGYRVSVSTCLHRGNIHTMRETVRLMASLGVGSMKLGATMELGEWADPALRELTLTKEEEMRAFMQYIPEFFEDGAPMSVMLAGTFSYNKPQESWSFSCYRPCSVKWERQVLSCPSIKRGFYLGADGMVAPCMGMCDCNYASNFPNAYRTPLREILGDSTFMSLCATTVAQVRDGNDKCRDCAHIKKCTGGCRNTALIKSNNFYDVDEDVCYFFENGWDERMQAVSEASYLEYCRKNGLEPKPQDGPREDDEDFC